MQMKNIFLKKDTTHTGNILKHVVIIKFILKMCVGVRLRVRGGCVRGCVCVRGSLGVWVWDVFFRNFEF